MNARIVPPDEVEEYQGTRYARFGTPTVGRPAVDPLPPVYVTVTPGPDGPTGSIDIEVPHTNYGLEGATALAERIFNATRYFRANGTA